MQQFTGVSLLDETCVICQLSLEWDYDEVLSLAQAIISLIDGANIVEEIYGADRLTVRFLFAQSDYTLHLECNSQACWIESVTSSQEELLAIHSQLTDCLGTFL